MTVPAQGLIDDGLGAITLQGRKIKVRLEQALLTPVGLTRSIGQESSLTMTVDDPERALVPDLLGRRPVTDTFKSNPVDLNLDGLWFRLLRLGNPDTPDAWNLTLGDREIEVFKRFHNHARASRADTTLPAFVRGRLLAAAPYIAFYCPDLARRPSRHNLPATQVQQYKDSKRDPGIADGANITIKGKPANPTQIKILNNLLDVAESAGGAGGVSHRVGLALVCAAIGESTVSYATAPENSLGTYVGPLQGNKSRFKPTDDIKQAHFFLFGGEGYNEGGAIALARKNPTMSPGEIATRVETSGEAPSFYGKYESEAEVIIAAYGGITRDPNALGTHDVYIKQAIYSQGPPDGPAGEDAYAMGRRYADATQRRFFVVAGACYLYSDWDLIRSRPRMTIDSRTRGIDSINGDLSARGVKPDQITVQCRAKRWAAPPGTVVVIREDEYPYDGAWIVGEITRPDITQQATTITLVRPHKLAREPASTIATRSTTAVSTSTRDGGNNPGDVTTPTSGAIPTGLKTPKAKWNPLERPMVAAIVPILQWASDHGWSGTVYSGWRSAAAQLQAASNYVSQLGKTMAQVYPNGPLASNHCKSTYPGGAVDVSQPAQLAQVLKGYPHTPNLIWAGPVIDDDAHFSFNGH